MDILDKLFQEAEAKKSTNIQQKNTGSKSSGSITPPSSTYTGVKTTVKDDDEDKPKELNTLVASEIDWGKLQQKGKDVAFQATKFVNPANGDVVVSPLDRNDYTLQGSDFMTDQERKAFNSQWASSPTKALDYWKTIYPDLRKREADGAGFWERNIITVGLNTEAGVTGTVALLDELAGRERTKEMEAIIGGAGQYAQGTAEKNEAEDVAFAGNVVQGFAQLVPQVLMSVINPALGIAAMGVPAFGNYSEEAKSKGASVTERLIYGGIGAAAEVTLQKVLYIDKLLAKTLGKGIVSSGVVINGLVNMNKSYVNVLKNIGVQSLGEAAEEAFINPVTGLVAKATFDPERAMTGEGGVFDIKQMAYDGLLGFIVSGGISTATATISLPQLHEAKNFIDENYPQILAMAYNLPDTTTIPVANAEETGNKLWSKFANLKAKAKEVGVAEPTETPKYKSRVIAEEWRTGAKQVSSNDVIKLSKQLEEDYAAYAEVMKQPFDMNIPEHSWAVDGLQNVDKTVTGAIEKIKESTTEKQGKADLIEYKGFLEKVLGMKNLPDNYKKSVRSAIETIDQTYDAYFAKKPATEATTASGEDTNTGTVTAENIVGEAIRTLNKEKLEEYEIDDTSAVQYNKASDLNLIPTIESGLAEGKSIVEIANEIVDSQKKLPKKQRISKADAEAMVFSVQALQEGISNAVKKESLVLAFNETNEKKKPKKVSEQIAEEYNEVKGIGKINKAYEKKKAAEPEIEIIHKDQNDKVIGKKTNKTSELFNELKDVIELMKKNVLLRGQSVVLSDKVRWDYLTKEEVENRGYEAKDPEADGAYKWRIFGYHVHHGAGEQIVLYKGANRETLLEETIHNLQRQLIDINPEFAKAVEVWNQNLLATLKNLGFNYPKRAGKKQNSFLFEQFAHAVISSEMGWADGNEDIANAYAIDSEAVATIRDILGKELFDAFLGESKPILQKTDRPINASFSELIAKDAKLPKTKEFTKGKNGEKLFQMAEVNITYDKNLYVKDVKSVVLVHAPDGVKSFDESLPYRELKTIDAAEEHNISSERIKDYHEKIAIARQSKENELIRKQVIIPKISGKTSQVTEVVLSQGCGRNAILAERILFGLEELKTKIAACYGGTCFVNFKINMVYSGQGRNINITETKFAPERLFDKWFKDAEFLADLKNSIFIRHGVQGDDSHSIATGVAANWLQHCRDANITKRNVFVSSGYAPVTSEQYRELAQYNDIAILHISTSPWFSKNENLLRMAEYKRAKDAGVNVIMRVVTNSDNVSGINMTTRYEWLVKEYEKLGVTQADVLETPFHDDRPKDELPNEYKDQTPKLRSKATGDFLNVCCETGKCSTCSFKCMNNPNPDHSLIEFLDKPDTFEYEMPEKMLGEGIYDLRLSKTQVNFSMKADKAIRAEIAREIGKYYDKGDADAKVMASEALADLQIARKRFRPMDGRAGLKDYFSGQGKVTGLSFSRELIDNGKINLTGLEIKSVEDFAEIAQIYRDPRFETMRMIFTKGDTVVGQEAVSSRLPSSSVTYFEKNNRDFVKNKESLMRRLGADGYYLIHNHPSGNPEPSFADLQATSILANLLKGFKNHIVINSNLYTNIYMENGGIDADKNLKLDLGKDKLLVPSIPNPLLGTMVTSPDDVARITKNMQVDENMSIAIFMDAKNKISSIMEINNAIIPNKKEFKSFITNRATEYAGTRIVIVSKKLDVPSQLILFDFVVDGVLADALIGTSQTVRQLGVTPTAPFWQQEYKDRKFRIKPAEPMAFSMKPLSGVSKSQMLVDVNGLMMKYDGSMDMNKLIRNHQSAFIHVLETTGQSILDANNAVKLDGMVQFDDGIKNIDLIEEYFDDVKKSDGSVIATTPRLDAPQNLEMEYAMQGYHNQRENQAIPSSYSEENIGDYSVKGDNALAVDSDGNDLSRQQMALFKDSQVRDADGNLKVVYHGTDDSTYTIFKKGDLGFHFGSENQANNRMSWKFDNSIPVEEQKKSWKVKPYYLFIKNPYEASSDMGDWNASNVAYMLIESEAFEEADEIAELERIEKLPSEKYSDSGNVALRDFFMAKGYDGIVYHNSFESDSFEDSYIAFYPNQIKSIFNENPTSDPDIRFSMKQERYSSMIGYDFGGRVYEGTKTIDNKKQYVFGAYVNGKYVDDNFVTDYKGFREIVDSYDFPNRRNYSMKQYAPPMYSKLQQVISNKMQNSSTPEQILNLLVSKNVKEDEIKWSGIRTFLEGKTKVSKTELMEFLKASELQIVDSTMYIPENGDYDPLLEAREAVLKKEYEIFDNLVASGEEFENSDIEDILDRLREDDLLIADREMIGESIVLEYYQLTMELQDLEDQADAAEADTYKSYTVRGEKSKNYREILFQIFGIEGGFTSVHYEYDENIFAHARVSEVRSKSVNSKLGANVLFIEEVQSDWHEAGLKDGYKSAENTFDPNQHSITVKTYELESSRMYRLVVDGVDSSVYAADYEIRAVKQLENDDNIMDAAKEYLIQQYKPRQDAYKVPDAPFKKNWNEYVLKRLIRLAAEEDYDMIAWTTGQQQNDRYNLQKNVSEIRWEEYMPNRYELKVIGLGSEGSPMLIDESSVSIKKISSLVGKDIARQISESTKGSGIITGDNLTIGGEGMKNFYDIGGKSSMNIPSFLNKYGKQWGTSVEEVEIGVEGRMWIAPSMIITPEMKESVLYTGQELFSMAQTERADFREWFSGSQVVDGLNMPLKVPYANGMAYFDIKNPLDITEGKRTLTDEQIDRMSVGSFNAIGLPDREILRAIGNMYEDKNQLLATLQEVLPYDGIIDRESNSYVAFNPKQIVMVEETPKMPKRSEPTASTNRSKDLIALHNIKMHELEASMELGALPMPSIAITRTDTPFVDFGEVSLVFNSKTIDPKNKKNKVYGADAWTPTFPEIRYKLNTGKISRVYNKINSILGDTFNEYSIGLDDSNLRDAANNNNGDIARSYKDKTGLMVAFLKEKGIKFNPIITEKQLLQGVISNDVLKKINESIGDRLTTADEGGYEELSAMSSEIQSLVNKYTREEYGVDLFDANEKLSYHYIASIADSVRRIRNNPNLNAIDYYATKDAVEKVIENHRAEYDKWVSDLFDGMIEKKGIRNQKDLYTNNGRRSFDALHYEYTLDNIIKAMKEQDAKGTQSFSPLSRIMAVASKEYRSLADIINDSGRLELMPIDEHEELRDGLFNRFTDIANEYSKQASNIGDAMQYLDRFADTVTGVVEERINTTSGIQKYFEKWMRIQITEASAQDILDLLDEMRNLPVSYFEAKPQQLVYFDQVKRAVVPDGTSQKIVDRLLELGVGEVVSYDGNDLGTYEFGNDQWEKVVTTPDVLFSMSQESARKLEKWFGDSKIVDEASNPMMLYRSNHRLLDTEGVFHKEFGMIYLTTSREFAERWKRSNGDREVYSVYVYAQNPYDWRNEAQRAEFIEVFKENFYERFPKNQSTDDLWRMWEYGLGWGDYMPMEDEIGIKTLIQLGYDAMWISESDDSAAKGIHTLAVFDSAQCKSVDAKEFDRGSNNIFYAMKDDGRAEMSYKETFLNGEVTKKVTKKINQIADKGVFGYSVMSNESLMREARIYFDRETNGGKNIESIEKWILGDEPASAMMYACAMMLQDHYMNKKLLGLFEWKTGHVVDITVAMANKAKNQGQAIQALSMWGRLSPEGIIRYATNLLNDSMTKREREKIMSYAYAMKAAFEKEDVAAAAMVDVDKIVNDLRQNYDLEQENVKAMARVLATAVEGDEVSMMADTLLRYAKERFPDESFPTPMEFVVSAIKNRKKYKEIWNKTQSELWFNIPDEQKNALITSKFFNYTPTSFVEASKLRQAIGDQLKEMNTTIKNIVTDSYVNQKQSAEYIVEGLMRDVELNRTDAEMLERKIRQAITRMTESKKKSIAESMFKEKGEKTKETEAIDRLVKMSNIGVLGDSQYRLAIGQKLGVHNISPEFLDSLNRKAQILQTLEGRERVEQAAMIMDDIAAVQPISVWKKVSMFQTMAQLLNPVTFLRNFYGNTGFALAEYIADNLAIPLDWAAWRLGQSNIGKKIGLTGERTTIYRPLQKIMREMEGFKQGYSEAKRDINLGIDTSQAATKFDISTKRVFRNGAMGYAEKMLSKELRTFDRAAYMAAYVDSLEEQMTIAEVDSPTIEMMEIAHALGLYRTFQDDNMLSNLFVGAKKAFNVVGLGGKKGLKTKDIGIGDLVLKYPRTPANLLARGIDYSPAGFMITAVKFFADTDSSPYLRQKLLVSGLSRGMIGTGLIAIGAMMVREGILTGGGDDEEPKDITLLKKMMGLGKFQINRSALKRWLLSGGVFGGDSGGLQAGDKLTSYDWFMPMGLLIGLGADIEQNGASGGLGVNLLVAMEQSAATLVDQPLMRGIATLFGANAYGTAGERLAEGFTNVLQGAAASFMPSLISRSTQGLFNEARNPYNPNDWGRTALNLMQVKTPLVGGLGKLPEVPSYTTPFGDDAVYYADDKHPVKRFFDAFLNPAYENQYKPNALANWTLKVYEARPEEGETIAPSSKPKWTYKFETDAGDVEVKLTQEEYKELSTFKGKRMLEEYSKVYNRYGDLGADTTDKDIDRIIKALSNASYDIGREVTEQVKIMRNIEQ